VDGEIEPREGELLAAAGHDPIAFEAFYRRTVDRVVAFAAARCRSPEDVADLVADTYVAVIASADRYDPQRGEALAWVYGIAANVHAAGRRSERRQARTVAKLSGRRLLDDDDVARLEEMIDAASIASRASKAVRNLPDAQREILELVSAGHEPADAARFLGIAPAAARMRLARARAAVRVELANGEPHAPARLGRRRPPHGGTS